MDKFKTLNKKTIIAIVAICILAIVAIVGVVAFLKDDGSATAIDEIAQQEPESENANTNASENVEQSPSATENNSDAQGNTSSENTTNNSVMPSESANPTTNTTSQPSTSVAPTTQATGTTTSTTNTNVPNQEYVTSRVEEVERQISEDLAVSWQNLDVAGKFTDVNVEDLGITAVKKAYVIKDKELIPQRAENEDAKTVVPGDEIRYVIEIKNISQEARKEIRVSDSVPAQTSLIDVSNGGTETTVDGVTKIFWTVDFEDGEEVTSVSFTVRVNEDATGTIRNTAVVNGDKTNETHNTIIDTTKTSEIVKCDREEFEGTTVHENDEIKYTLTIKNTGDIAEKVSVSDAIKDGLTFKEGSLEVDNSDVPVKVENGVVSLEDYELAANTTLKISFVATVNPLGENADGSPATSGKIDANKVTVNSKETTDKTPDGGDKDYDVVKPYVETSKASKVVKCDDYGMIDGDGVDKVKTVHEGDEIEYTITVSNKKGTASDLVSLRDEIPEGLTFIAGSLNAEAINADVQVIDNVLTLDDYTIDAEAVLNITFRVRVNELGETKNEDGTITKNTHAKLEANKVIVNGDKENPKEDPDPPTDVKKPMISTTKVGEVIECTEYNQTGKVNVVHENDMIKYTITALNSGDEKGKVNLTDTIKSGLSFVSVATTRGTVQQVTDAGGKVTGIKVENYELAAGDSLVITLVVKVDELTKNDLVKVEDNKYVYKKVIDANVVTVNDENIPEDGGNKEVQKPWIETTKTSVVSECTEPEGLKQTGNVSTVHEGDTISYMITVSNEKGSASKVINVEDPIPDGLTLDETSVKVSKEVKNMTVSDNKISISGYTLEAGEKLIITFNVTVDKLSDDDYVEDENGNKACIKSLAPNIAVVDTIEAKDPNPPTEVKKAVIETTKVSKVVKCDDYSMIDGDGIDKVKTVHEGDEIEYTITVSNEKGTASDFVSLRDEIPEGLTFVAGSLNDEAVSADVKVTDNVLTLDDYTIEAGAVLSITFKVRVNELGVTENPDGTKTKNTYAELKANKVIVNGDTDNPKEDPNPPTEVKKPNIEISKTSTVAGKDYVRVGESFDYIITAKNNGTEKGNAVITDVIPDEFTIDIANIKVDDQVADNSVVVSGNKVEWTITDLAAESSKVLKIRVTAKDINGVKAETTNTATIDNENPSSSTDVDIGKSDIDVTKSSQVVTCNDYGMTGSKIDVVHEGDEIQYTIIVENYGVVSDKINVRDELKDKVEFVEGSLTAKVDSKDITGVKAENGVISLDDYELAAGSKLVITFKVRVKTLGLDEKGNKITKATFEANTVNVNGDPTEDPNGPGEIRKPDLKVTKSSSIEAGQYAEIGKQFSYYIVVDNNGDEKGSAVVEDEVPSNLRIDSYGDALAGDTISVVGNKVTWNVNNLPAKTSRRIEIKVTPLSISEGKTEETITNTAKITNGPDSPTDVTIATPIISTTKASKVAVCGKYGMIDEDGATKVTTVHEGDEIEYTITISNTGKVAGIVNMNDPLPTGMTFKAGSLSTSLPNVNVVVANDKKSISLNDYLLAANTTLTITFRVTIDNLGTKIVDGKEVPATSATLTANEVTVNGDPAKDPNPPTDVKKPMITATKETPAADEAYITENRLVEYTITVTNNGTEKGNATVTDVIDSRLEYKQSALVNKYDKDSISYDKNTKTVTWNVVDLLAGESRTATITVWVGEITNGVSETIPNIVNVDGKPTDEETITVGKPSIKTEKTSEILECSKGIKEGTIVHEGDVIKYTIKVKNEGTLPKKISVTDTIKSGLTYVEGTLSVDRANTGASITNGLLTITDYELSAGQEMTITFNVRVNELTDADYSKDKDGNIIYSKKIDANVASVDGKSPSDGKEYEVIKPVINVKKEVSKTLVSVNEEFYYDITVTNVGTDVGNTVITDTIPSELIYNGFVKPTNDDVVTYDETTRLLTWNVNALKVKESRKLRINVKAPADVTVNPTIVTNAVYKDGSDKPEDSVNTEVAKPEITTTKSSEVTECKLNLTTEDTIGKTATTVHEGDVIKYTITITNSGKVAGIVNMNDSLPAGMTFKDGSLTTSLSNVNVVVANDKKSISLKDYSLAGNTTLTITFEVTIDNLGTVKDKDGKDVPATSATLTANTVTVNGVDEKDPNPPTTVKKPNIVIAKTSNVGNRYLNVGETFEYTITATNNGTEVGTAVVTDRLPDGVEYVSYTDNGDTVDVSKLPEIKWTVKDLGVNESRELKIQVKAKGFTEGVEKSITNKATIDNGNPSSEVTDKVGKPQISANKTSRVAVCGQYGMIDSEGATKVTTVHEGDEIEYTITISNNGKVAGIVNMNDSLPAGMTFKDGSLGTSITGANVIVANDKKSILLNNYSLAAGATLTITFRVTIDNLGTTIVNGKEVPATSATLTANTVNVNGVDREDPNPPTDVKKPIINTTKTSVISECGKGQTSGTTVHEGDKIKYTITVSNSGTEYKNINVSDTLKPGVSLLENTMSAKDNENDIQGITVSTDKRTISLNGYRLEAGHTLTITFEVSVDTLGENVTKATIEANQVTVDTTTTTDDKTYEVVKPNINVIKQVLNTEGNDINEKTVDVRSTLKYVLVGTNTGDEDSNVTITDDIDISKLTDVTVTGAIRTNGTDASTAVTYNKETGKLEWSGLLKKNSGNQVIITIEAKTRILNESELSYVVENTAKYTPEGSSEKTTNKVTNNVKIMIESDKTATVINAERDGKAEYGDIIEYTITAENKSDSDGKVNIIDPLPAGVEYSNPLDGNANPIVVKVNGTTVGNGTYNDGTISYNGTLKAGAKLTLTFKVKAIETNIENDIVNTATINGIEKSATVDVVKKISIAATAEVTKSMDLVLVLDVSGSMNGKRIDALKEAAKALVNKVFPDGASDTNSTVTIIAYNGTATDPVTYKYNNKIGAISTINDLQAITGQSTSGTNIKAALDKTNTVLTDGTLSNGNKVVIFLSDGAPTTPNDTTGLVDEGDSTYGMYQQNSVENIVESAKNVKKNADRVYSIGLGTEDGLSDKCAYVTECSELADVITSRSSVNRNNNKVTITLRNSSSRDITVTELTANISGITGVTSEGVTYTEAMWGNQGTLTWDNDIIVPANGTVSLEVGITRDPYSWSGPSVSNITPEYERVCSNATHQAMNSVVPFDGVKYSNGKGYHYYTEKSLAKFVLKTIGKTKYIPVAEGADTTDTTNNLSKEFDAILKDSSTTHDTAVVTTKPTKLKIVETATVKGDVVLSIGETSYTINIDTLKNGAYSLVTGDELSYTPGVGFTFTIKNDKTLEKELHIAYTVDKK